MNKGKKLSDDEEIFKLSPEWLGVGVDLKLLWRKIKEYVKKEHSLTKSGSFSKIKVPALRLLKVLFLVLVIFMLIVAGYYTFSKLYGSASTITQKQNVDNIDKFAVAVNKWEKDNSNISDLMRDGSKSRILVITEDNESLFKLNYANLGSKMNKITENELYKIVGTFTGELLAFDKVRGKYFVLWKTNYDNKFLELARQWGAKDIHFISSHEIQFYDYGVSNPLIFNFKTREVSLASSEEIKRYEDEVQARIKAILE